MAEPLDAEATADAKHTLRNAAAVVLANLEHLEIVFQDARSDAPLLEYEPEERRRDALRSIESAARAAQRLVSALRKLDL